MSHKTLAELQSDLQDFLLDKKRDADDLTLETPAFSKEARLHIYHEAYRLRLIDALSNDYPALKLFLGEDIFTNLANEFISAHPSHHPSLRWFGEKLPEFLKSNTDWHEQLHIVELAEFEWAQAMTFDAADEIVSTLDHIRALPPESWMTMKLVFHPSLQLLNCVINAPLQWQALIKDGITIEPVIATEFQTWLIWRENLQVVYRPLDAAEAWALNAFITDHNFSNVCGGLCEWFAEEKVPLQTAQYLQQWLKSELIIGIITEPSA
ncbi:MAG: DUF2063 domain-containing protein [Gammaproteobacteria bacterium]|nr:MAG: DUF2063 domain-containing protein [Gammaproteobacteria bacterium]